MKRTKPRTALIVGCVGALAACAAGPAQAAVLSYTSTATAVTADSATLNGSVVTGGVTAGWEFSYGPADQPFAQAYSDGGAIPAGGPPSVPVVAQLTNLIPGTIYSLQLVATTGVPDSTTAPLTNAFGGVVTFTTKGAGSASLTSSDLKVKNGRATDGVRCASTLTCQGTVTITTRHQGRKVACGNFAFTVKAGTTSTVTSGKLSGECRKLLAPAIPKKVKAKKGSPKKPSPKTINAYLQALFTTYQPTISQPVTLTTVP
jgi:hypothetical protein